MKLSVIILNYNVRYYLELCLQSVSRALENIESEIIVVDNASFDDSVTMVKSNFPEVMLIENPSNFGFSKGNNIGVTRAVGEYICILNPDTVLPESCFDKLLAFAETKIDMGAIGIRLIDGSGNFLPESKRNLPTPAIAAKKMIGLGSAYYAGEVGEEETESVPVLVGAFMLLRRSVYKEVKGFDEDYFMYGEDIDLSYSLTQKGYKNYYLGAVTAIHFKGESTQKDREYNRRFYGAMRIFYRKHFQGSEFTDGLLGFGLWMARLKGSAGQKKSKVEKDQDGLFWIGKNAKNIPDPALKYELQIDFRTPEVLFNNSTIDKKLILDAESLSFSEIIGLFERLKNKGNRFRIRPSNCNFSIGSDSSRFTGQIIKW